MRFLGRFLLGQTVRLSVTWNPLPGEPPISASSVTITHEETDTVIGPTVGAGALNEWSAEVEPTLRGNWRVEWGSTPEGGLTSDRIYVS